MAIYVFNIQMIATFSGVTPKTVIDDYTLTNVEWDMNFGGGVELA